MRNAGLSFLVFVLIGIVGWAEKAAAQQPLWTSRTFVVAADGGDGTAPRALGLNTSTRVEISPCVAGGGDGGTANQGTLLEGTYLFRAIGDTVNVCFGVADAGSALTCPSGGEAFPNGTVMNQYVPRGGLGVSCRSATDAGSAVWTRSY